MRLIVLYGPPAVGKNTVAKELAKHTNMRVFDSTPLASTIEQAIGRDNPQFTPLLYSLQIQILNAAMRFGTQDIILTATFSTELQTDVALLQTILEAGQAHNTNVTLVHLTAKHHALTERVQQPDRRSAGKMTDPSQLQSLLGQYNYDKPFTGAPSITINTTHLTAAEVAGQVARNIATQ